jgi:putative phosphoesterase
MECDEIWHAGDIGDIAVMDQLKKIAPVRAVYGNIDNHIVRAEYPEHNRFTLEGVTVWITHIGGKPYAYDYRLREEINKNPPKIFICGHSHICKVQLDKKLKMLYMNPGAAGIHGFHKIRTMLRFTLDNGDIKDLEVIELGKRA